jgi:hypothetical protein
LFKVEKTVFTFGEKEIPKGQYRLPFSIKLPNHLPGSFLLEERDGGNSMGIGYSIKIYLKTLKKIIYCRKEIIVREFLFTPEEIDLDWQKYKSLLAVKQMLKP